MKIDYTESNEWQVGDVIHSKDSSLYLVVATFLNYSESSPQYSLIGLDNGYAVGKSYSTLKELQRQLCSKDDYILNGTFKYINDDKGE